MDRFSCFLPFSPQHTDDGVDFTIEKSAESPQVAKIRGIISSENADQQGDILLQDGLDFSYFLSRGFLNDDHKSGAGNILGEPVSVSRTLVNGKPATMMEGNLYLSKPQARAVYESACAMKAAKSSRSLGFSVEGQVLERDPTDQKIVRKARILHVAITSSPVNLDAANLELIARSSTSAGNMDSIVAKNAAQSILQMHPELARADILNALTNLLSFSGSHESQTEKSSIGYQQPAVPAENAPLSPLVPSSVSSKVSSAAGLPKKKKGGDPASVADPSTTMYSMSVNEGSEKYNMSTVKQQLMTAALNVLSANYVKQSESDFQKFSAAILNSLDAPTPAEQDAAADAESDKMAYSMPADSTPAILNSMPADSTPATKQAKLVSAKRLSSVLSTSFPHLSATQVKKLASSLVFAARNRL